MMFMLAVSRLRHSFGFGGTALVLRRPAPAAAVSLAVLLAAAIMLFATRDTAAAMSLEPLEIATKTGVVVLEVEVAQTDEERATGLMYRKSLPDHRGMLFDFKVDQPIFMWMKNTYIPLDMLFIRSDGTIARIAAMTTPLSTQTIPSGEPARAVVEIAGGAARKLGIAPGDRVAHRIFQAK